jgi:uncharacterized damage-inducible protein DinB
MFFRFEYVSFLSGNMCVNYQMKFSLTFINLFFIIVFQVMGQNGKLTNSVINEDLPYYRIPEETGSYSAGTVAARVIDGLGFRYYWATEGLLEKDLEFKPSEMARTTAETIEHIYGLSRTILNTLDQNSIHETNQGQSLSFTEIRKNTLENFKKSSEILKATSDQDIGNFKIIMKRGGNSIEFPFWNLLNGQISDAIYHTGQVVSFRRSSGNPIHPGISVFTGTVRE